MKPCEDCENPRIPRSKFCFRHAPNNQLTALLKKASRVPQNEKPVGDLFLEAAVAMEIIKRSIEETDLLVRKLANKLGVVIP